MPPAEANRRRLRASDVILASFPRSGNTWMRFLLADLVLQRAGIETTTEFPVELRAIVPDYQTDDIDAAEARFCEPFRIVKSHDLSAIAGRRTIYVLRQPADTLCSLYHYRVRNKQIEGVAIDDFCLASLDAWRRHYETALAAKRARPGGVLFVSYEGLHENAEDVLRTAARFLDTRASGAMIARAVANHTFEKRKANQEQRVARGEDLRYPFRKGAIGSSAGELRAETAAAIAAASAEVFARAREAEEADCSRHGRGGE